MGQDAQLLFVNYKRSSLRSLFECFLVLFKIFQVERRHLRTPCAIAFSSFLESARLLCNLANSWPGNLGKFNYASPLLFFFPSERLQLFGERSCYSLCYAESGTSCPFFLFLVSTSAFALKVLIELNIWSLNEIFLRNVFTYALMCKFVYRIRNFKLRMSNITLKLHVPSISSLYEMFLRNYVFKGALMYHFVLRIWNFKFQVRNVKNYILHSYFEFWISTQISINFSF